MLPLTPPKLGRYEIVDEIGKGAMGVVYLARDPLIGRLVALKTFRIGYSVKDHELEQFRARFIREAQSAGILSHPNIVTIHDVVEDSADGMAFIAMEYVRGTNLKALLQGDQPLSLQFVCDVISQVADALDYAHSHKVVHRDVKPANILITADNRVKITDFGIARLDTSNLTQEGQLLGTPNYMAPEQIQGREVDHRADLFALGVVLYEMLTRRKPFQGENLTVVSHRIVYDHFTPPREYVKELPPGLEPILTRALEKDPARRYQRARDLVEDLRKVAGRLSADDLNETQSISAMAPVLVPPPPLPALGSGAADGTAGTGEMAAAAPAATPATGPARPRQPVSWRRVTLFGGLAALLTLALGAGALLAIAWTTPVVDHDRQEEMARVQFLSYVRTAHQLLRTGDWMTAAAYYRQAEKLFPNKPKVREMRLHAERQAREFPALISLQQQVEAKLLETRQAMEARRYDQAIAAATAAVVLDPNRRDAHDLLAEAQRAQAEAQRQAALKPTNRNPRRPQDQMAATSEPTPELGPASSEGGTEIAAQAAVLQISFDSTVAANVRVQVGRDMLLRRDVGGTAGRIPFRRRSKGGQIDESFQITAGSAEVKVWVTRLRSKEPAFHRVLLGSFPAGSSHSLDIRLSEFGEPTITLN